MFIKVNREKCTGCSLCISSCPYDAIVLHEERAQITPLCQLCRACLGVCPEGAISEVAEASDQKEKGQGSGVWVFAEQRDGVIAGVSLELLGAGRRLAGQLGTDLSAVLFGKVGPGPEELIRWGADRVYYCADDSVANFNDEPYARLLADLITEHRPEIVLAGATAIGRSFIPRIAARLHTGLTADCTSLEIDPETRDLLQVRPAFGGNIMATILCPHTRPQMATVRPRVMKPAEYASDRKGEIIPVSAAQAVSRTRVVETIREVSEVAVNLADANIIVAGGRGVGGEKGFALLFELADALGASIGASRGAVDEGWIPYRHQVGQTGKTVGPKIYIACGISGAVQHVVGMQSSDIIIAINKNPEAPIFNIATYGIVGEIAEIIPLLTRKIREAKGL
ncbi:MAG: electron transfer flavoprotein subunit alpha [Nitrospirae bacterium]|nr:MAG: electron transfer flavoprotein subunit alpha [Nitrospirota bacterium]